MTAELISQESDMHERRAGKLQQGQPCAGRTGRGPGRVTAPAQLPGWAQASRARLPSSSQWLTSSHSKQVFAHLWEKSHFAKVGGTQCHILRLHHPCSLSFFNIEQEKKEPLTLCGLCCMKSSSTVQRKHFLPSFFIAQPHHPPGALLQLPTLSFIFKYKPPPLSPSWFNNWTGPIEASSVSAVLY